MIQKTKTAKIYAERLKNCLKHVTKIEQTFIGMIQIQGNWMPRVLKAKDVESHLFTSEQLLKRNKWQMFLHRIVTGSIGTMRQSDFPAQ